MINLGTVLLSGILGFAYAYAYYEWNIRNPAAILILAILTLVVIPFALGLMGKRSKIYLVLANIAAAWGAMFLSAVGIWSDGL